MDGLSELQAWLILQRIPGVGPVRLHQLLKYFGSPQAVLAASPPQLQSVPESIQLTIKDIQRLAKQHPLYQQMQYDRDYLQHNDIHVVTLLDDTYPELLREIANAPPVLYIKGNLGCLLEPQIAIIGARKASQFGLNSSYQWAQYLANHGLVITSGLALGIDGAAHQGAVDNGKPTIAVLAHGMDSIYPRRHQKLAQSIIEQGALVTEFPLGLPAKREHFPRRNRIISGLSLGLLMVEATIKSGSMITAKYAVEQNRDVFAIPGHIHDKQVSGCFQLLKQGAYLVTEAEDILQQLNWQRRDFDMLEQQQEKLKVSKNSESTDFGWDADVDAFIGLSDELKRLLENIPFSPMHIDELVDKTGIQTALLSGLLLQLEVLQYLACVGGNYQRIK